MRARQALVRLGAWIAVVAPLACGRPARTPPPARNQAATTELTGATSASQPAAAGLFRFAGDEATFQDCTTGRSFQVVMEADYLSTQHAYTSAAGRAPGAPMMIKAFVHVVQTPHVGDRERHDMIVIDRLVEASNDTSTCAAAQSGPSSLAAARWRLVELDGKPIARTVTEAWPPPAIVLNERDQTLAGIAGCSDIQGRWTRPDGPGDRGRLELSGITATPRGCTPSADDTAFVRALEETHRYEVVGSRLVLFDDARPRARFEAERD